MGLACPNNKWDFEALFENPIVNAMNSQHQLAGLILIQLEATESAEFILPYSDSHFEVHQIFKKEQIKPKIAYQILGDETRILSRARIKKDIHPHQLRHSYATHQRTCFLV
ncbi:hypothetical protein V7122_21880 [Bacillus sp. JJ1532]|uniref:hypothetical protein n=1 Tax=Bacillus sp. JJ1532 TaxID=3122958 RepID=UPI0030001491